jgi:rhodanese-related sulfurtransferase
LTHALLQLLGPNGVPVLILLEELVIAGDGVPKLSHEGDSKVFSIWHDFLSPIPGVAKADSKVEVGNDMAALLEINPAEAQAQLNSSKQSALIDVREPWEFAVASIGGSLLIPMQSVPAELQRLEGLADEGDLLVLCHHGVRSLQVVSWLRAQGIENCYSITGGIDRWSAELEPAIPRY